MSIERDMYEEMIEIMGGREGYRTKEMAEEKMEKLAKWLVRKFMKETDGGWNMDKADKETL